MTATVNDDLIGNFEEQLDAIPMNQPSLLKRLIWDFNDILAGDVSDDNAALSPEQWRARAEASKALKALLALADTPLALVRLTRWAFHDFAGDYVDRLEALEHEFEDANCGLRLGPRLTWKDFSEIARRRNFRRVTANLTQPVA